MKKAVIILFFLFLLSFDNSNVSAQCSMCKATVENNDGKKETLAAGLNTGILYLMSVPYLAMVVVGYLWYRNSRRGNGKNRKAKGNTAGEMSRL
jgi:hypothetical protein